MLRPVLVLALVSVAGQSLAFNVRDHHRQRDTMPVSLSDIVERVNTNPSSTWKAGHNFHPDTPTSYLESLMGTLPLDESNPDHREFIFQVQQNRNQFAESRAHFGKSRPRLDGDDDDDDLETMGCPNAKGLPRNFDARQKWPECRSIRHIQDQSHCGACWAISVASAISDRLCIETKGFFQGLISAQQLLSCTKHTGGCKGGWPLQAWSHWGHAGVVTGGDYGSNEGCQPYTLPPCEHYVEGPLPNCTKLGELKTPECKSECWNPSYGASYNFDLTYGKKAHVVPRCNAMRQIYEHGPIIAAYSVYEDFLQYKSGVYQHNFGKAVGLHAVRVIGWGIENDIPYWLVTNSWNDHWGDHGTFKILRGENEADFEMMMNVGYPRFLHLH